MELFEFVHRENLKLYKKQLEIAANEAHRRQLLTLLIEERERNQTYPNVHIGELAISAPACR